MGPESALLTASALHLGFQAAVTVVVYPALAELPVDAWPTSHAAHSRRIVWVVGPVYLAVAAAGLWVLISGPYTLLVLVAVAGNALAALTTAFVAAPTHGRLGKEGPTPSLLRRLMRADRVRLVGLSWPSAPLCWPPDNGGYGGRLGVLDRPWRHLHRCRREAR